MGIKTVITLYPKRQKMKEMYNLYICCISYILFSVFLRKTMKNLSSLPLKSPTCENVFSTRRFARMHVHIPVGGVK